MTRLWIIAGCVPIALAGCASDGAAGPSPEECSARVDAYAQYIRGHRSCESDEDCRTFCDTCAPEGECGQAYLGLGAERDRIQELSDAVAACDGDAGAGSPAARYCTATCLSLRAEPVCTDGQCARGTEAGSCSVRIRD